MKRVIHWLRAQVWGECPHCHGTHLKDVYGWAKSTCQDCGETLAWETF